RPDRSQVEAFLQLSPVRLPDGRVTAATLALRDLREKREADRSLRTHADIFAHTPDGILVWRLDDVDNPASLRLLMANRAAEQMAGFPLTDWIGRQFADVSFIAAGADDPAAYAQVARTGQPADFGECSRSMGGEARWYQVRAFPLPAQAVGVIFRDITAE